jgi:hypothetical protein
MNYISINLFVIFKKLIKIESNKELLPHALKKGKNVYGLGKTDTGSESKGIHLIVLLVLILLLSRVDNRTN